MLPARDEIRGQLDMNQRLVKTYKGSITALMQESIM